MRLEFRKSLKWPEARGLFPLGYTSIKAILHLKLKFNSGSKSSGSNIYVRVFPSLELFSSVNRPDCGQKNHCDMTVKRSEQCSSEEQGTKARP